MRSIWTINDQHRKKTIIEKKVGEVVCNRITKGQEKPYMCVSKEQTARMLDIKKYLRSCNHVAACYLESLRAPK